MSLKAGVPKLLVSPDRIPFPLPVPSMLPRGWLWGALGGLPTGRLLDRPGSGVQAGASSVHSCPPLPRWLAGLPGDPGTDPLIGSRES